MDFSRNDILNIFIGVIIIFALIIFIDVINLDLNPIPSNKKIVQVVNIEALKNNKKKSKKTTITETNNSTTTDSNEILSPPQENKPNTVINLNPVSDFCKSSSDSLKTSCGKLTKKNCNSTSCCIVLNGDKCVAGNQDGPTFKTESGKDITIDYYYYQNKCYGNNCPTNKS